jgi:hypothetical protein
MESLDTVDPWELARIITEAKKLAIGFRRLIRPPAGHYRTGGRVRGGPPARPSPGRGQARRLRRVTRRQHENPDQGPLHITRPRVGSGSASSGARKQWDTVALVLLDSDFEPTAIYEARRPNILEAEAHTSYLRTRPDEGFVR